MHLQGFWPKTVYLKCFGNQLKTVYLQGPHSSRPCISRPCCIWNHQFSKITTDLYARNMFTECVWQILNFKHFSLPDTEKLNFWFDKFVKSHNTQTEVNIFPASFSNLEPLWASPWAATIFFQAHHDAASRKQLQFIPKWSSSNKKSALTLPPNDFL